MRWAGGCAAWLLVAMSFSAGGAAPAGDSGIVAAGTLAKDAVWAGTVRVDGTVTVSRETLLTVKPGAVVLFGKDAGLVIEGRLVAEGTEKAPIRFESGETPAAPGAWAGIRFAGSRTGSVLAHCRVADAASVHVEGCSPSIRKCVISRGGVGIHVERNAAPEIDGNAIEGMARAAIVVEKDSAPVVSGNTVRSCALAGIQVAEGAAPALRGNTVSECEAGIVVTGATSPIERNVLRKNKQGMVIRSAGPGLAIRGNRFVENDAGLVCAQFASPVVERNEFTGNGDGVVCFRSSCPLVRNNEIAKNGRGIVCTNISSAKIVANDIHDNRTGIFLTLSSYAVVSGNNIFGNGVQLELGNMSSDWERRVGRKPARGTRAQMEEYVGRGRATARDLEKAMRDDGAVIMGSVDATGNWWGEKDTAQMEAKGADANIDGLVDGRDVPVRTYEGYPGEYVQDRINYDGWKKSRVADAGVR